MTRTKFVTSCALVVIAAPLAVGCARSIGGFAEVANTDPILLSRGAQTTPVTAETGDDQSLKPAVVVEETTADPPAPATIARGTYPNLNDPPKEPGGKLLSPEEKARVIAELEALARNQGASVTKKPPAAKKTEPCEVVEGEAAADCKPVE